STQVARFGSPGAGQLPMAVARVALQSAIRPASVANGPERQSLRVARQSSTQAWSRFRQVSLASCLASRQSAVHTPNRSLASSLHAFTPAGSGIDSGGQLVMTQPLNCDRHAFS